MYPIIFIHIVTCVKTGVVSAWGKERQVCVVDSQIKLPICFLKSNRLGFRVLFLMKSGREYPRQRCAWSPCVISCFLRFKRKSFTSHKHHIIEFRLELRLLICSLWKRGRLSLEDLMSPVWSSGPYKWGKDAEEWESEPRPHGGNPGRPRRCWKGARTWGCRRTSRSWKRFSHDHPKNVTLQHLDFSSVRLSLYFKSQEPWDDEFVVSYVVQGNAWSRRGKLMKASRHGHGGAVASPSLASSPATPAPQRWTPGPGLRNNAPFLEWSLTDLSWTESSRKAQISPCLTLLYVCVWVNIVL